MDENEVDVFQVERCQRCIDRGDSRIVVFDPGGDLGRHEQNLASHHGRTDVFPYAALILISLRRVDISVTGTDRRLHCGSGLFVIDEPRAQPSFGTVTVFDGYRSHSGCSCALSVLAADGHRVALVAGDRPEPFAVYTLTGSDEGDVRLPQEEDLVEAVVYYGFLFHGRHSAINARRIGVGRSPCMQPLDLSLGELLCRVRRCIFVASRRSDPVAHELMHVLLPFCLAKLAQVAPPFIALRVRAFTPALLDFLSVLRLVKPLRDVLCHKDNFS